jgi:hypothetical protein
VLAIFGLLLLISIPHNIIGSIPEPALKVREDKRISLADGIHALGFETG